MPRPSSIAPPASRLIRTSARSRRSSILISLPCKASRPPLLPIERRKDGTMFRTLQNTASLQLTLVPDGPILVRAQSVGIDPGLADMEFQRTRRDGQSTVFLAG